VVLGHIAAGALSGGVTLDVDAAQRAIGALAQQLGDTVPRVARAMLDVADASVARALRRVSVERGVDPRDCVLVPFGGGGPLHCCGLAEQLGMRRIFVPPHAGVLSALGLAITAERRERIVSLLAVTDALDQAALGRALDRAAEQVAGGKGWQRSWVARARYVGQGYELDVPMVRGDAGADVAARFAALHRSRNGFTLDAPVEVIGVRHVASGPAREVRFARQGASRFGREHLVDDGGAFDATLGDGAVVALPGATLRIAAGWTGSPHHTGGWLLVREEVGT
jgi:N-methylhydantoinase A